GDLGVSSGVLGASGQGPALATADIHMNGLGTVDVHVEDASANAVSGAQVTVSSFGAFGSTSYTGVTSSTGDLQVFQVLAGSVGASASWNNLRGQAALVSLAAG